MTPRYWLPNDTARCVPSQPCTLKGRCLRYLAPRPTHYATIADFSLGINSLACLHRIPVETKIDIAPEQKPKPWPSQIEREAALDRMVEDAQRMGLYE